VNPESPSEAAWSRRRWPEGTAVGRRYFKRWVGFGGARFATKHKSMSATPITRVLRLLPPPTTREYRTSSIHLRLPKTLRTRTEEYALADRRSVSDVVNIALENFFKQSRPA